MAGLARLATFAIACVLLLTPVARAQQAETCLPTGTLDELIKAIDQAVSGAANRDRTCFRALMLPGTRQYVDIRRGLPQG